MLSSSLFEQENVLAESRMMIPDCHKRLEASLADLQGILVILLALMIVKLWFGSSFLILSFVTFRKSSKKKAREAQKLMKRRKLLWRLKLCLRVEQVNEYFSSNVFWLPDDLVLVSFWFWYKLLNWSGFTTESIWLLGIVLSVSFSSSLRLCLE